jgi:hypothetical protein
MKVKRAQVGNVVNFSAFTMIWDGVSEWFLLPILSE